MHSMVTAPPGVQKSAGQPAPPIPVFRRSLASFSKSNPNQQCFDRRTESYTAVTDAHFHPRPFGGQAIPPAELFEILDRTGVRFVNYFGIGQSLDMASDCTYYLDCPGTAALPSIKNDFVNAQEVKVYPHDNLHITLIAGRIILVVVFDDRSSLGLVRLRVKKAGAQLAKVFEDIQKKSERDHASGAATPFSEITDEDIDNLFSV